ncbi:MAG: prolyl oligopeptidase family serine peptidase [Pseudomonadota bacterium]
MPLATPAVRGHRLSLLTVLIAMASAAAAQTPDLEQIMADPDWIGSPVQAVWWQLDGTQALYRVKREGSDATDIVAVSLDSGNTQVLDFAAQAGSDGASPVVDAQGQRALFTREGSLWLRELATGGLRQLAGADVPVSSPRFGADPGTVQFRRGGRWWQQDLDTGVARALAQLKFEDAPYEVEENSLTADQVRLFVEVADAVEAERAAHEEARAAAVVDTGRPTAPWYLGAGKRVIASAPSADGRWLLAAIGPAKEDEGKADHMPKFVTRSGYVEVEDVRQLVGRNARAGQSLWLLDLQTHTKHAIDLTVLSGTDVDPLADLKTAQDLTPYDADNRRPVYVSALEWHRRDAVAAIQLFAVDNKDRWLITVDARGDAPATTERHRLHDPAWVSYSFNDFGWVPGDMADALWLLSEESGYSHLYTVSLGDGKLHRVTDGTFEVSQVTPEANGATVLAITNHAHPTEHDLYRIDLANGSLTRLTELLGVEDYARLPGDVGHVLVRHSGPYLPSQVSLVDGRTGLVRQLTDTRTAAYRDILWQPPTYVGVPSHHDAGAPIWSKFYPARGEAPAAGAKRPAVLFVHGAGYTQNTHHKFPYYFREQMFHTLLTSLGYHVLDMDYRASRGYGRDWRAAIYRQMGTPELEDLIDGVRWLVEEHDVDPQRIGVYGGSYGGFMAFMAMFNAPEVFAAGAALRPVTDWAHYNHPYTSNILNTPQVDPEAYLRSSPIEFAEGLKGDLLISHGMLDDNVFYKDSVRLAQRLIDLGKTDWELASYPLEPHGYVHASSWLDQYRRILKLFEGSIGTASP